MSAVILLNEPQESLKVTFRPLRLSITSSAIGLTSTPYFVAKTECHGLRLRDGLLRNPHAARRHRLQRSLATLAIERGGIPATVLFPSPLIQSRSPTCDREQSL